jgi:hypothetical protein
MIEVVIVIAVVVCIFLITGASRRTARQSRRTAFAGREDVPKLPYPSAVARRGRHARAVVAELKDRDPARTLIKGR